MVGPCSSCRNHTRRSLTGAAVESTDAAQSSFLSWLLDRLILRPSRHRIDAGGEQLVLPYGDHKLEVWIHSRGPESTSRPSLYVLEFPGTASRAEQPADFIDGHWSDTHVVIWSVNPLGYGGSSGTASLRELPSAACHAFDELQKVAGASPIVVAGGSLGSVSALYLAARRETDGVLIQNPPDLREVILQRGSWHPIRWLARAFVNQIPIELSSLRNAEQATVPAVFVLAQQDEVVPHDVQQRIVEAYAGPKRVIELPDATHDAKLTDAEQQELLTCKAWLHDVVGGQPD